MSFMVRVFCAGLLLCVLGMGCAFAEVKPLPIDINGGMPPLESGYLSDSEYEDESIHVQIEEHMVGVTRCVVARVKIADASQMRSASAYGFDRRQAEKTMRISKRVKAVVAINGDYYGYTGKGYMIRQGQLYMDKPHGDRDVLLVDANGDFTIVPQADDAALEPYKAMDIVNSYNFGPGLVVDGEPLTGYNAKFNAGDEKRQRSCIAQMKRGSLEYLLICSEGPSERAGGGLTMDDFAAFVHSLGVENAYNLDGGNSVSMVFKNKKQNAVKNNYERPVSDIIYFASAQVQE